MKTKTKKFSMAVAALLLGTTLMMASGPDESKQNAIQESLRSEIRKQIQFPEFAKQANLDERIEVSFKVTSGGKLAITNISGGNEELKKYVENIFSGLKVDKQFEGSQLYGMSIRFKFKEA